MTYWVVMFDRDGGEQEPEGPFDCQSDAQSYGEFAVDYWGWVSYVIQKKEDGIMYYVQYKVDGEQWVNDLKCGSLDEALIYAVPEARNTMVLKHRVVMIKKNGKVKVLAKFKPLSSYL